MLAPVMAAFLLAIFWRRMTAAAALAAFSLAIPMLVLVYLRQFGGVLAGINIFNLSGIVFVISTALIAAVSQLTNPPATAGIETMLWHRELVTFPAGEADPPWWKRAGLWFGLVVAMFIAIYAVFW
jgi:SSS family solute:Na+ symporter